MLLWNSIKGIINDLPAGCQYGAAWIMGRWRYRQWGGCDRRMDAQQALPRQAAKPVISAAAW